MFLKNINISSKIKRSKVTDYVALRQLIGFGADLRFIFVWAREHMSRKAKINKSFFARTGVQSSPSGVKG